MIKQVTFYPHICVGYDYDTYRECDLAGCDSICRCSRIENLRVTEVQLSLLAFSFKENYLTKANHKRSHQYEPSLIEIYCVDRLARLCRVYDADRYTAHAVSGYYGEEVGDIDFDNEDQLTTSINLMLNMPDDIDKIKFVLTKEYSFLLDSLQRTSTVQIVSIDLDDLIVNDEYLQRMKAQNASGYEFMTHSSDVQPNRIPVGVVLATKSGYRLIDGYHRLSALKLKGTKSASYICLV